MTITTKPESGVGLSEAEAIQVDEDDAAIESGNRERLPQRVTNAVDESELAVWCKVNCLTDEVVRTLQDAGFRAPKDLIDRETDLDDVKLRRRESRLLDEAISKMRIATASNSVDNATLGLATKDKQQHIEARDDDAPKGQRVAESVSDEHAGDHSFSDDGNTTTSKEKDAVAVADTSASSEFSAALAAACQKAKELADDGNLDDEIQQAFDLHRNTNKIDWQKQNVPASHFLTSSVPHCRGRIDFLASTEYIGATSYSSLNEKHVKLGFETNVQLRRITAIVQSFGCGKTRAAIELSKDHIVLPLRVIPEHPLICEVIDAQTQLREKLGTNPTGKQIKEFSERCLRLVHLVLLSLRALLAHCVKLGVVNRQMPSHRRELALLLLLSESSLVAWALRWFRQQKEVVLSQSRKEFDSLVREVTNKEEVVFVFDEVHKLFNHCLGYCVEKDYMEETLLIGRWRNEQLNKDLAGRGRNDLFYQLRRVIHDWYYDEAETEACFSAFVMCSTSFSIWNDILVLDSPFNSNIITCFNQLHWFSPKDVRMCIKVYFAVSDELLNTCEVALSLFRRPRFVTTLLDKLAKTKVEADMTVNDWFKTGLNDGLCLAYKNARSKVKRLANMQLRLASKSYSSTDLLFKLYVIDKLCGGTCLQLEDDELADQINTGIVRLVQSQETGCTQTADPIFSLAVEAEVLEKCMNSVNDEVVMALLRLQESSGLLGDTTGMKGSACERVVAWIAMSGRLRVSLKGNLITLRPAEPPKVVIGTSGSDVPRKLQLLRAGTSEELNAHQKQDVAKASLLWSVMTGAFFGVLFPDNLCGPDIVFHVSEVDLPIVVMIQCKNWNQHLTPCNFKPALFSLQPAFFYKSTKNEAPETQKSADRIQWLKTLKACKCKLRELMIVRIVFAPLGFSAAVQYFVREYNDAEARKLRLPEASATAHEQYIYLMTLDDIKAEIGESAYKSMLNVAKGTNDLSVMPNIANTLMLQSEWNALTSEEKEVMSEKQLKDMCKVRDINYGGHDKASIISELNKYDVEAALKKLKLELVL